MHSYKAALGRLEPIISDTKATTPQLYFNDKTDIKNLVKKENIFPEDLAKGLNYIIIFFKAPLTVS